MSDNMVCPKCGGTNIKPVGIYYQCQSLRGVFNVSCGFIAEKEEFRVNTLDRF